MALSHSPKIVTSGLVLHLDAANIKSYPTSGTTWTDLSGTGNYQTLTNGPTYSSNNNGKITFDGVDDYALLNTNSIANNLSSMTVSVWVYANWSASNSYCPLVTKIADAGSGAGWELGKNWGAANTVYFYLQNAGGSNWNGEVATVTSGTYWMNIVANYQSGTNSTISIYINGNKATTTHVGSGTVGSTSTTSAVAIATRNGSNSYGTKYASCDISNLQIYERALSESEIIQNFNAFRGRFGL